MKHLFKLNKAQYGWAIYDWANSAFATTVMAGFFPIFFKNFWSYGTDVNVSTAQLGFANSIGSLIVALLGPVMGAVADRAAAKKTFLVLFAYLGVLMTASLFLVERGAWKMAALFYVLGLVGFSGSNIFYDALLGDVADETERDYLSGFGYAMGYLGGGVLFTLNVLMTLYPGWFGLADAGSAVRFSFLSVALWWGIFTFFTIFWVKEKPHRAVVAKLNLSIIRDGVRQYLNTFRKIKKLKTVFLFLGAYWLYIDGVDTIIRMAVDYAQSLNFQQEDLITALLLVQFIGFPASILYGKLGEMWDIRKAIFLAILLYMIITFQGIFLSSITEFYILAAMIGLVQGGIQALSRSYYLRLIPPAQTGEFFGFYNMMGKFAVILGPAFMGLVGLLVKRYLVSSMSSPSDIEQISMLASRWGIASLLILFVAGGILFYFVDEKKGRAEILKFQQEKTG